MASVQRNVAAGDKDQFHGEAGNSRAAGSSLISTVPAGDASNNSNSNNNNNNAAIDRLTKNAFIAALFCCLFPLLDHNNGTGTGDTSRSELESRDASEDVSMPENSPYAFIHKGSLHLGNRTLPSFLAALHTRQQYMLDGGMANPKVSLFCVSVGKFLSQINQFKTSELSDCQTLILLYGSLVAEELRETLPNPSLNQATKQKPQGDSLTDDQILTQVDLFLDVLREVVAAEPNSASTSSFMLLQPGAAWDNQVRMLLAVFLDNPPPQSLTDSFHSRNFYRGFQTKFGHLENAEGVGRLRDGRNVNKNGYSDVCEWLRSMFAMDEVTFKRAVAQVRSVCNDRVAFSELKAYLRELIEDRVASAPHDDWDYADIYDQWREKEILLMSAFEVAYRQRVPGITVLEESTNLFLPPMPNRLEFFKVVVSKCVIQDFRHSDAEVSTNSKLVIAECAYRWQISKKRRDIVFLEVLWDLYAQSALPLTVVVPLIEQILTDASKTRINFRRSERSAYVEVLRKLDFQIRKLLRSFTFLLEMPPEDSRAILAGWVDLMEKIRTDRVWVETNKETSGDILEEVVINNLKDAVVARFNSQVASIVNDATTTHSQNRITRLCLVLDMICRDSDNYRQHVPEKLLGKPIIQSIVDVTFVEYVINEMMEFRSIKVDALTSVDLVMGPRGLYRSVIALYKKIGFQKLRDSFDIEAWFSPYVMEWLNRTDTKWRDWAENAVATDNFEPILAPTTMYSSSVRDIFLFFNNGLNFMLGWTTVSTTLRNDMVVLFLQMMCKTLTTFTDNLFDEFREIEAEPPSSKRCITYEACIKLNNVIGARTLLAAIVTTLGLDYEHRRSQRGVIPSQSTADSFEVNIIKAEGLEERGVGASEVFVTMTIGSSAAQQTKTVGNTSKITWNESFTIDIPRGKKPEKCYLDFAVFVENDEGDAHEVLGKTLSQDRVFLLQPKFNDHEVHEIALGLVPEGVLTISVKKEGEIQDIDFWAKKAKNILETSAESMIKCIIKRIVSHCEDCWTQVMEEAKVHAKSLEPKSVFETIFTLSGSPPPKEYNADKSLIPMLTYLDRNMSLLNEGLGRILLNNKLRRMYPYLGVPFSESLEHWIVGVQARKDLDDDTLEGSFGETDSDNDSDGSEARQRRAEAEYQAKRDLNSPSLLCLVVWVELMAKISSRVQAFVGGVSPKEKVFVQTSAATATLPSSSTSPQPIPIVPRGSSAAILTHLDIAQIAALDATTESIKAFFYNEIEGRCNGFPLTVLEDEQYVKSKSLMTNLQVLHANRMTAKQ